MIDQTWPEESSSKHRPCRNRTVVAIRSLRAIRRRRRRGRGAAGAGHRSRSRQPGPRHDRQRPGVRHPRARPAPVHRRAEGRIRIVDRARRRCCATPFLDITHKVSSGRRARPVLRRVPPRIREQRVLLRLLHRQPAATSRSSATTSAPTPTWRDPGSGRDAADRPPPAGRTTTAASCRSVRRRAPVRRRWATAAARAIASCNAQPGDTLLGKMLRLDVRQNLNQAPYLRHPRRQPVHRRGRSRQPGAATRSGRWACATPGGSRSIG